MFDYGFYKTFIKGETFGIILLVIFTHFLLSLFVAYYAQRKGYSFAEHFIRSIFDGVFREWHYIFLLPQNKDVPTEESRFSFQHHAEKLDWTYSFLIRCTENDVKTIFPNGKEQMGETIIKVLKFCGHDPDKCNSQTYMRAARVYMLIVANEDDPKDTTELLTKSYKDIVKNEGTAKEAVFFFK